MDFLSTFLDRKKRMEYLKYFWKIGSVYTVICTFYYVRAVFLSTLESPQTRINWDTLSWVDKMSYLEPAFWDHAPNFFTSLFFYVTSFSLISAVLLVEIKDYRAKTGKDKKEK